MHNLAHVFDAYDIHFILRVHFRAFAHTTLDTVDCLQFFLHNTYFLGT